MVLSDEERKRIYEEEQRKIEAANRFNLKGSGKGCLILVAFVVGVMVIVWVISGIKDRFESKAENERRQAVQKYVDSIWAARKSDSTITTIDDFNLRIPVSGDRKIDLYSMAQMLVKKTLKSPSTASFPWSADEYDVYDLGSSRYSVSSWVDSKNSFGANIRTRFTIIMKNIGDSWRLESIHTE